MKSILRVEREHMREIPEFSVGDTIRVHVQVVEGEKVRSQIFQGTVLARSGSGLRATFTVRKISGGVSVERIFPLHSPTVVKVERTRIGHVRRAKLTYMRSRKGKSARIAGQDVSMVAKTKRSKKAAAPAAEAAEAPAVEETAATE